MKKVVKGILSCAVILALCCAGQGCKKGNAAKKGAAARMMPKAMVGVEKVVMVQDRQVRRYTAQVVSRSEVNVVSRVSGEILKVGFKDGSAVKAGQLLYQLDPIQYEAAVKGAEAKVAECKAKLEYAQKNFDRKSLLYTKQIASQDAVESTESDLGVYRAALLAAQAQLITAKDNLKNTKIISPIDGIAGVTAFTKGNYLTPSSGVLTSVIQVDPIRVCFAISTADYLEMFGSEAALKRFARITVTLPNGKKFMEKGGVELINNEANVRTDSIQVYALFANKSKNLIPGSTVSVTMEKIVSGKYPAVRPSAVMHDAKGSFVYVPDARNVVTKRYITTGNLNGDYQLVTKGLKAGEKVVISGTHKTMPGGQIIPQEGVK